ncbi:MAG: phosphotransferase [Sedimentisphaerales bacterium]|nr:phosphotransferase [Sedimentisphaerales bacterium]
MVKGGAHFSSEELVKVLSHYDIGVVHRVTPLTGGDRRAPKVVVAAEKGTFLLKRRPRRRDDLARVTFAHAIGRQLAERSFPVTALLTTVDDGRTALSLENHIYEFFRFVEGSRCDGSVEATREAGRKLALLHRHLARVTLTDVDVTGGVCAMDACFHDSATVRRHLKLIGSGRRTGSRHKARAVVESLLVRYDRSSARVDRFGFATWKRQVIHGDWHPGNLLFAGGRIVAILDFDSIRIAPPPTDLANGMLQFSIVGDQTDPAGWPDHFDRDRLLGLLDGYREVTRLSERKLHSLVDLMIETMIAEAVMPVAATGFFGQHSGLSFLDMIVRKTKWLRRYRKELTQAMLT